MTNHPKWSIWHVIWRHYQNETGIQNRSSNIGCCSECESACDACTSFHMQVRMLIIDDGLYNVESPLHVQYILYTLQHLMLAQPWCGIQLESSQGAATRHSIWFPGLARTHIEIKCNLTSFSAWLRPHVLIHSVIHVLWILSQVDYAAFKSREVGSTL